MYVGDFDMSRMSGIWNSGWEGRKKGRQLSLKGPWAKRKDLKVIIKIEESYQRTN